MYTMSFLCIIVLCALCLPFLAFGQEKCACTDAGNSCDFRRRYLHPHNESNRENIALGKPATITSIVIGGFGEDLKKSGCLATNGNRNRWIKYYATDRRGANCVQTHDNDFSPKLTVNLLGVYTIMEIQLIPAIMGMFAIMEAEVTVDNQFCYKVKQELKRYYFTCESSVAGQFVAVLRNVNRKPGYPNYHSLMLCEIEVWVCMEGYFGDNCNDTCEGCATGCHHFNGSCLTKECNDGFYSLPLCNLPCGHCKLNTTCDINGTCPLGCQEGWIGDMCNDALAPSVEAGAGSLGLILGIIVGLLALLAGLLYVLAKRRKTEEETVNKEPDVENPPEEELAPPEEVIEPPEEQSPPAIPDENVIVDEKEEIPENEKKGSVGSAASMKLNNDNAEGDEAPGEIVPDAP